jgi:hypothetical protein
MTFIPKDKDAFSHFLADIKNFFEVEKEFKKILDNVKRDISEGRDIDIKGIDKDCEKLKGTIIAYAIMSKGLKESEFEKEHLKERG